ncbi:MAG: bifunctional diguanylate cyclase/phosphodiesterase [Pseudomonadota bacterium]
MKNIHVSEIGDTDNDPVMLERQTLEANETPLASLLVPILLMASLVTAAILLIADYHNGAPVFGIWLLMHCMVVSVLFLLSLRTNLLTSGFEIRSLNRELRRPPVILLAFAWGTTPGVLSFFQAAALHLVFTSILCGLTLSAAVLMRMMPRTSKLLMCLVGGGFIANTLMLPDATSIIVSTVTLAYFSVMAICARWYSTRLERQLHDAELIAVQAQELSDVIQTLGDSTETYYWCTDTEGRLIETDKIGSFEANEFSQPPVGAILLDLFVPSSDSEALKSRFLRRSEIVALELERRSKGETEGNWWRLTGRPYFKGGVFKGYRGAATNISTLREREKRAEFLLEHDHLTGFLNRSSFHKAVQDKIDRSDFSHQHLALILIDLDNFKWVNDTFGHQGGDMLLKIVSERLVEVSPAGSVSSRFSGDEFALIVEEDSETALTHFARLLSKHLSDPYLIEDTEVQCAASIGMRRLHNGVHDANMLMKEADLALLAAKSAGRGTWREYSEEFEARVRGERDMANDLKAAIENDALSLQFQPIVDTVSLKPVGVEALSRWVHTKHGNIAPDVYIPLAESNGLIVDLGNAVLKQAIRAAAGIPPALTVSINISPVQMHSTTLLQLIRDTLAECQVSPERIELEITESVFLSDNEFVLSRLRALKDMGLKIALDDFGTGFSSLAYLQRFPFDKLKLDQTFVRGLEHSAQSRAIARATLSMAKALDLVVTAEGVETENQASFLREHRCDFLQGFLFSRPVDEADLPAVLVELSDQSSVKHTSARVVSL